MGGRNKIKIKAIIITKNRYIKNLEVNGLSEYFHYNKGLYTIPRDAVNFCFNPKKKNKKSIPELIYVEGQTTPVNAKNKDAGKFLDYVVLKNALNQVAAPKSMMLDVIAEYARSPMKMLMLVFVAIIAISFLGSIL